jgi:hypothetical protein
MARPRPDAPPETINVRYPIFITKVKYQIFKIANVEFIYYISAAALFTAAGDTSIRF